jgi:hypothetical protein
MQKIVYVLDPQIGHHSIIVREHMGWVRNVVLMNVYLGLEKPQRVGISGEGPHGQVREMKGVSLRTTRERGGRILSQQGGFQVSGKGQTRGTRGARG